MNADTPAIAIDCVQFRYGRLGRGAAMLPSC